MDDDTHFEPDPVEELASTRPDPHLRADNGPADAATLADGACPAACDAGEATLADDGPEGRPSASPGPTQDEGSDGSGAVVPPLGPAQAHPGPDPTVTRDEGRGAEGVASPARRRPAPSIPGFEILGELGRGGMGVVYLARRLVLNRPCALKMVLAAEHAGSEADVRFLAEAEAVARLKNPNVIQIYSVGEHDGYPYLELEFAEGGSLEKALDGTPWLARRAAGLVEPLARAVAEAHRRGFVHRDLKPANVLLTADGTPKVADFGLV